MKDKLIRAKQIQSLFYNMLEEHTLFLAEVDDLIDSKSGKEDDDKFRVLIDNVHKLKSSLDEYAKIAKWYRNLNARVIPKQSEASGEQSGAQ